MIFNLRHVNDTPHLSQSNTGTSDMQKNLRTAEDKEDSVDQDCPHDGLSNRFAIRRVINAADEFFMTFMEH